jgi:hypothetical protein
LAPEEARALFCLTAAAVAFFLAKTALVVLVEPPLVRYIRPAALLLPVIPVAGIAACVRLVVRSFARPAAGGQSGESTAGPGTDYAVRRSA